MKSLNRKEQDRYREIIRELTHLSRDGWKYASADDYLPLERELSELAARRDGQPGNHGRPPVRPVS